VKTCSQQIKCYAYWELHSERSDSYYHRIQDVHSWCHWLSHCPPTLCLSFIISAVHAAGHAMVRARATTGTHPFPVVRSTSLSSCLPSERPGACSTPLPSRRLSPPSPPMRCTLCGWRARPQRTRGGLHVGGTTAYTGGRGSRLRRSQRAARKPGRSAQARSPARAPSQALPSTRRCSRCRSSRAGRS